MAVIRLYTGDDGESHIEELDPAINPGWLVLQQATGIMFRTTRAGFFEDYHNAVSRQPAGARKGGGKRRLRLRGSGRVTNWRSNDGCDQALHGR